MGRFVVGVLSLLLFSAASAHAKGQDLSRMSFQCRLNGAQGHIELGSGDIQISRCSVLPDGRVLYALGRQSGTFCSVDYHTLAETSLDRPLRAAGHFYMRPGQRMVEFGAMILVLGKIDFGTNPEVLTAVVMSGSYAALGQPMSVIGGHIYRDQGEAIDCSVTFQ